MREVQEFARRKPGTFLVSAAFAGFVGESNMGESGIGEHAVPMPHATIPEKARQPLMESAGHVRQEVTEAVKESADQVGQWVKQHAKGAKDSVTER